MPAQAADIGNIAVPFSEVNFGTESGGYYNYTFSTTNLFKNNVYQKALSEGRVTFSNNNIRQSNKRRAVNSVFYTSNTEYF